MAAWQHLMECATVEVFEMMANVRLVPEPSAGDEPRGALTAIVGMGGALCGMTMLRCSRANAAKVASKMLGLDSATDPNAISDALGELCNMVAGNFKAKISTLAEHCLLSVPTVITGDDYSMQTAEPVNRLMLAFSYEGELIWVSLIVHA
jgi:chemotaxis protein CheX